MFWCPCTAGPSLAPATAIPATAFPPPPFPPPQYPPSPQITAAQAYQNARELRQRGHGLLEVAPRELAQRHLVHVNLKLLQRLLHRLDIKEEVDQVDDGLGQLGLRAPLKHVCRRARLVVVANVQREEGVGVLQCRGPGRDG